MSAADLRVEPRRSLAELEPLAAELDALNLASRRPCAFATFAYLRAMVTHDEYARDGDRLLLLLAWRGDALAGFLPLRLSTERVLGAEVGRVALAVSHDTDRPRVIARAGDERACAEAFWRHLARAERWAKADLVLQDDASGLWPVPLPAWRFHRRRFANEPAVTIPLPASLPEYFRGLSGEFRNTVGRMTRRVARAGRLEVVSSRDPRAARPLLDLYVDVERRSWKVAAEAGVTRHPRRLAFFQALCEPGQPLTLAATLVLLDGVPICALLSGVFGDLYYAFETTYDGAYGDLAPGYLTWLMAIRQGIAWGLRSYNLQSAYAYYKERWSGVATPTFAVQVYRIPSLPWARALGGALLRRLRGPGPAPTLHNEAKRAVEGKAPDGPAARPDRSAARALAEGTLAALERDGVAVERLSGPELAAALPFELEPAKPPPGPPGGRGKGGRAPRPPG